MLFSAEALDPKGIVPTLLDASKRFAGDLAVRLRERIYLEVVPRLAAAIANARNLRSPSAEDLDLTYRMALMVLFRLLEQRILAKIAMDATSIGVASPVQGAAHGEQVFTETREEIERLLREDNSLYERGGTVGAAQTGEEYRQTLRQALTTNRERVVNIPWKAGSG